MMVSFGWTQVIAASKKHTLGIPAPAAPMTGPRGACAAHP